MKTEKEIDGVSYDNWEEVDRIIRSLLLEMERKWEAMGGMQGSVKTRCRESI